MKKILLIHLLFISFFSYAQNYNLINSSNESHFLNNQSEIHSIRIDSSTMLGTDSIFYNHKVLTQTYFFPPCALILTDSSWIGNRIISKSNNDYIFFNQNNDSILIKSSAIISDNWKLYTFNNGDYIEASLTNINLQAIFSSSDSIKIITLQAKNSSNINISHSMNGKEIRFSKNNGLVSFFNIQNFPNDTSAYILTGFSNPNTAITNLTAADIYNYDVGDEFHYKDYWQDLYNMWTFSNSSIIKIILSKTTSLNQDTITYTIDRHQSTTSRWSSSTTSSTTTLRDTITEKYVLSSLEKLNKLSFESIDTSINNIGGYSIFSINQIHNKRQKTLYDIYYRPSINCWEEQIIHPGPFTPYYLEGLGGGYYHSDINIFFDLVFYKKGTVTWGTPILISVNELALAKKKIEIFPNPFSESTTIKIENYNSNEKLVFNLFNITGKEVSSISILQSSFTLKKGELPAGIYFYQIKTPNKKVYNTGKIIIQ